MTYIRVCLSLGLVVAIIAAYADCRLERSGELSIGEDVRFGVKAIPEGWVGQMLGQWGCDVPDGVTKTVQWQLRAGTQRFGNGDSCALALADGRIMLRSTIRLDKDYRTEGLVCLAVFPERALLGGSVLLDDGVRVETPAKFEKLFVVSGVARKITLHRADHVAPLVIELPKGTYIELQDDRQWNATFSLRIYIAGKGVLKSGCSYEKTIFLSGGEGILVYPEPHVVHSGAEWLPLEYFREVAPGSAADFSRLRFRAGPAGRHGWLICRDGNFEFEKLPGVGQRFWGANLCGRANCPSHADADRVLDRMERAGYNAIRIHHFENALVYGSRDRMTFNPEAMERFDYLFAQAKRRGFYMTTDLYVSRKVLWKDVGVDREGAIPMDLCKALFLVYEPAFDNWKTFARNFLSHVNPYTGVSYADDPAMPFLSLVNEGVFAWKYGGMDDDIIRDAWRRWLSEKRLQNPAAYPHAPDDCKGHSIKDWKVAMHEGIVDFMSDMESRFAARAKEYLRSIGAKALLSDWNCGPYPRASAITDNLDYMDMHFYIDHPEFIGGGWSLPALVGNSNPYQAIESMQIDIGRLATEAGRPYTVSEWNFTAPNAARGAAGLLAGACASVHDWDAMWRFTYLGDVKELDDNGSSLDYFGIVSDPFMVASDRAGIALYLGRQVAPRGRQLDIEGSYAFPIDINKRNGGFRVAYDALAGGWELPGGRMVAGPLTAEIEESAAALWIQSVDLSSLRTAKRMLLTHLTDLKQDGMTFSDENCTVLKNMGTRRMLVRDGCAEISLAIENPAGYEVWGLRSNGAREELIATRIDNGRLAFQVSVKGAGGKARFLYEVVKKKDICR